MQDRVPRRPAARARSSVVTSRMVRPGAGRDSAIMRARWRGMDGNHGQGGWPIRAQGARSGRETFRGDSPEVV